MAKGILLGSLKKVVDYVEEQEALDEDWFELPSATAKTLDLKIEDLEDLREECIAKLDNGKLTDEARQEAEEADLDPDAYKTLLKIGSGGKELTANEFVDQMTSLYRAGILSTEKLIQEKKVNLLAKKYHKIKEKIPIAKLLHMNPGEAVSKQKKVTTFVHKMFETNVNKDDIVYFFEKLGRAASNNNKLFGSYLSLSDEKGRDIKSIINEYDLKPEYLGIKEKIDGVAPNLYAQKHKTTHLEVDTHTASIHGSVDKSFSALALSYDSNKVKLEEDSERVVVVKRDAKWKEKINNHITELETRLNEIILDDSSVESFIKPTLARGEDITEPSNKFKFQAKAALRALDGLKKDGFGNQFSIRSNAEVSCGLTPKEIVAIGYHSLSDQENWNNPEMKTQHFMSFVENIYVAKRGYNIDSHGPDEWKTHPDKADYNKCPGGFVNQIAQGLADHKNVEISVVNLDTMKPVLIKKLNNILQALSKDTDMNQEMGLWVDSELIGEKLRNQVISKLKEDTEFKAEFSESEINDVGAKVLRKMNSEEIKESLKAVELQSNNSFVDTFIFDDNKGYILRSEKFHEDNRKEYLKVLNEDYLSTLIKEIDTSPDDYPRDPKIVHIMSSLDVMLNSTDRAFISSTESAVKENFQKAKRKESILYIASKHNLPSLIKPIIDAGADIKAKDKDGETPLHKAASSGSIEIVKLLLENGADIEAKDKYGKTPLQYAVKANKVETVKALLENRADIEAKNALGETPLQYAAKTGSGEIAKALIEKGANIEAKDKDEETPLQYAVKANKVETVKALLENRADIEAKNEYGQTPLHKAASSGSIEIVKLLLEKGADIEAKNGLGETPLHRAASYGSIENVKALLKNGADTEAKDQYGHTPLHRAASYESIEIVKLLLENGANTDTALKDEENLLQYAVKENKVEIVKALLENGADIYENYIVAFDRLEDIFDLATPGSDIEKLLLDEKNKIEKIKDAFEERVKDLLKKEVTRDIDYKRAASEIHKAMSEDLPTDTVIGSIKEALKKAVEEQQEHSKKGVLGKAASYIKGLTPDLKKQARDAAKGLRKAAKGSNNKTTRNTTPSRENRQR